MAILLSAFSIWYVLDAIYVESLPEGRYYHYSYGVRIDNVSSDFVVILPLAVLENGIVLPHIDFEDIEYADAEIISTSYGLGLRIASNHYLNFELKGEYDATQESSDYEYDGIPILSMSSLNHTYWVRRTDTGNAWMSSDTEGLYISMGFESWWKDWKIRSGTFHNGYVRGGGGYSFSIGTYTSAGWHQYDVGVGVIAVE